MLLLLIHGLHATRVGLKFENPVIADVADQFLGKIFNSGSALKHLRPTPLLQLVVPLDCLRSTYFLIYRPFSGVELGPDNSKEILI